MSEKTISREDYYKLHGLLALAQQHNRALDAIARAAGEITGEEDDGYGYFGCTSDEVNEPSPSADSLLRKLNISVAVASMEGER